MWASGSALGTLPGDVPVGFVWFSSGTWFHVLWGHQGRRRSGQMRAPLGTDPFLAVTVLALSAPTQPDAEAGHVPVGSDMS